MVFGENSSSTASLAGSRPYRLAYVAFLQLADVGFIVAILWATSEHFYSWAPHYLIAGCVAAMVYLILGNQSSVYTSFSGESFTSHILKLFRVWGWVVATCVVAAYATKTSELYSRAAVLTWFLLTPVALGVLHSIIDKLFRQLRRTESVKRAAVIGVSSTAIELARTIIDRPELGLRLEGIYAETSESRPDKSNFSYEVLGDMSKLIEAARSGSYDSILLVGSVLSSTEMIRLVHALAECHVELRYVPDAFTRSLLSSRASDIGGITCFNVYDSPLDGFGKVLKRVEDLVLGTMILSLIAIPMLIIAFAIKASSPGPVLFKQRRYGYRGEPIEVWKFRTMSVCEDGEAAVQARKNDPRVTSLGSFLRKTSLDELPQFLNVLYGTMSVVGPRPHPIALNEQFRLEIEGYMLRHVVKPGITGWAQINGWRGETDTIEKMEQRVQHDLHYIRNWSVWLDLEIIVMTVLRVFHDEKAY